MITIKSKTVTPMLRLILEWSPVSNVSSYEVRIREASQEAAAAERTDSTLYRVGQALRNACWYQVQVAALDAEGQVLDTSEVQNVWTSAQTGTAPLLRQAVHDALDAAGIKLVADKWMPRAWGKTVSPSGGLPCVEIQMPSLESSAPYSGDSKLDTWQVPVLVRTESDRGDPDRDDRAWLLFERVKDTIDGNGLRLNGCGVLDGDWSWSASLTKSDRSKITVIEGTLTVPVRKPTGMILLPQPSEIPAEPVKPQSL